MARIFITGSADGLGLMSAQLLMEQGHEVVLHARTKARQNDLINKIRENSVVLTGDLSSIEETVNLAEQANRQAPFDAVIHNAGVYQTTGSQILAVNTLAPYILTCLINKPKRLIYLSSGMHSGGRPNLEYFKAQPDRISYSDSKLHIVMLTMAIARKWPEVYANAVDRGWVPTRMGGRNAPDDLQKGYETQSWLAVSNDGRAQLSGRYFFHKKERKYNPIADDVNLQEKLMTVLGELSGVSFPV